MKDVEIQASLLFGIIIVLIVVGIIGGYKGIENFSSLKKYNCKETFKVNGKRNCTTDRIPHIPEELPIGYLSTMGTPLVNQANCTSNVNGVQRFGTKNAFGVVVKDYDNVNQITQSYAPCEFGSNNIFDKDMLKY